MIKSQFAQQKIQQLQSDRVNQSLADVNFVSPSKVSQPSQTLYEHTIYEPDKFNSSIDTDWQ